MRSTAVAATLVLSACAAPAPAPDPAAAEVEAEIRRMYADLTARRWDGFRAHFAEGAVVIVKSRRGTITLIPISDFDSMTRKAVEGKPVYEERCEALDVRVFRDLAHAWSRFRARLGTAEKADAWGGVDAYTLVRADGAWRIAAIAVATDE